MLSLTHHLGVIITGLRAVIADHTTRDRARARLFTHIWLRLGRAANRLEALYNKWQSGTLPKPRPSRTAPPPMLMGGLGREADQGEGGQPQTPTPPETPTKRPTLPYIPQGHAWLVAAVGYHAAGRALQLQHLMAQPEFTEFLQAVPQTGRILRPLCRLLGIRPVPEPIRPPPRPPRVRKPKPPRPPRPPRIPLWQCYPQGIRRFRPITPRKRPKNSTP